MLASQLPLLLVLIPAIVRAECEIHLDFFSGLKEPIEKDKSWSWANIKVHRKPHDRLLVAPADKEPVTVVFSSSGRKEYNYILKGNTNSFALRPGASLILCPALHNTDKRQSIEHSSLKKALQQFHSNQIVLARESLGEFECAIFSNYDDASTEPEEEKPPTPENTVAKILADLQDSSRTESK